MHDAGEEPFGGDFTGHGHDDVHDDGPDSGEEAHQQTVAHGAAEMRGVGPASPKQDEGDCPEQLRGKHPTDAGVHFRIAAPELLRGPVIGHHPDAMDEKVGDKDDNECNGDSEKQTFDIHDRGMIARSGLK